MTTVACRSGVLAADTQMTCDGDIKAYGRKLVYVKEKNAWVGYAGLLSDCQKFVRWFSGEAPHETFDEEDDFSALIMYADGRVECMGSSLKAHRLEEDEFFAIGSGSSAAMAAMHMGADAKRAVEIAMLVDIGTGGEVVTASCGEKRVRRANAKGRARPRKAAQRRG